MSAIVKLEDYQEDDFNKKLKDLEMIQDTCAKLMKTPHYAKLGPEGICAIMARAKALGIHPFEALNGGFYNVNGKIGMSTEMMAALIRKRGHSITKDPKSTSECVILHGKRADNGDMWTCSFSKEDAIAAGLWNGPTWKKYPAVMLYNRCMSMLFRQLFPDLSLGAGYVEDELKEITKTGEYAKNPESLPMAESEEIKPKEEPKKVKTLINAEQVKALEFFIDGDEDFRKSLMTRLAKVGVNSLEEIPIGTYEKALAECKANFEKKEEQLIQQQLVTE